MCAFDVNGSLSRSLEDADSMCACAPADRICYAVSRVATDGQHCFSRTDFTVGFIPVPFRTSHFYLSLHFFLS